MAHHKTVVWGSEYWESSSNKYHREIKRSKIYALLVPRAAQVSLWELWIWRQNLSSSIITGYNERSPLLFSIQGTVYKVTPMRNTKIRRQPSVGETSVLSTETLWKKGSQLLRILIWEPNRTEIQHPKINSDQNMNEALLCSSTWPHTSLQIFQEIKPHYWTFSSILLISWIL